MMARYPVLAQAKNLPPDRAVFVAAYSAHLLLDLIWFRQIVVPMFYDAPQLGDLQEATFLTPCSA